METRLHRREERGDSCIPPLACGCVATRRRLSRRPNDARPAGLAVAIQRVCTEHTLDSRVLTTTLVDQRRRQHPELELPAA